MNIENEQKLFFDYIENSITVNKKISHAYLIETNGYKKYNEVVKELIKKILLINSSIEEHDKIIHQVDDGNYADLKYIYPDGANIKKEQLLNLEAQYSKKSMLNNKLIYVIDPADKLNSSSANTILKFLEEPPDDIIAILLTENKYNVLETIVSRCQCLSLVNKEEDEFSDIVEEFVDDLIDFKKILIKYDYYLENLFADRVMAIENLKLIEELLFKNLCENLYVNESYRIDFYEANIALIEREKENLKYNINIKIWLSNYIFQIMEVSNV